MAFVLRPLKELIDERGVKVVVHGPPGVGKTVLCTTLPEPNRTGMICAEGGLRSIRATVERYGMTGGEIRSFRDFEEAFAYFAYDPGARNFFRNLCLDSISEIADVCLKEELARNKDGRKAYGEMAVKMKTMIRAFRDLPYNVVFTAQQERSDTDDGTKFAPTFPGNQLSGKVSWMSHQFDEIYAYRIVADVEGKPRRLLQTQPDQMYDAKSRLANNLDGPPFLDFWEEPNLANLFAKAGINPQPSA